MDNSIVITLPEAPSFRATDSTQKSEAKVRKHLAKTPKQQIAAFTGKVGKPRADHSGNIVRAAIAAGIWDARLGKPAIANAQGSALVTKDANVRWSEQTRQQLAAALGICSANDTPALAYHLAYRTQTDGLASYPADFDEPAQCETVKPSTTNGVL